MPPLTCRLLLVSVGTKGLLCPGTEVLGLFQLSHAPKVSVEKLGPQKIRAKFWHRSGIWLCCFSGYLALRSNSCARSERSLGMWLDHAERRKRQYRVWIGCPATCYPVGVWCFVTFTIFVRFFFLIHWTIKWSLLFLLSAVHSIGSRDSRCSGEELPGFECFVSLAVSTAFPVWGHLVQPGLLAPFREQTLPAEVYIY